MPEIITGTYTTEPKNTVQYHLCETRDDTISIAGDQCLGTSAKPANYENFRFNTISAEVHKINTCAYLEYDNYYKAHKYMLTAQDTYTCTHEKICTIDESFCAENEIFDSNKCECVEVCVNPDIPNYTSANELSTCNDDNFNAFITDYVGYDKKYLQYACLCPDSHGNQDLRVLLNPNYNPTQCPEGQVWAYLDDTNTSEGCVTPASDCTDTSLDINGNCTCPNLFKIDDLGSCGTDIEYCNFLIPDSTPNYSQNPYEPTCECVAPLIMKNVGDHSVCLNSECDIDAKFLEASDICSNTDEIVETFNLDNDTCNYTFTCASDNNSSSSSSISSSLSSSDSNASTSSSSSLINDGCETGAHRDLITNECICDEGFIRDNNDTYCHPYSYYSSSSISSSSSSSDNNDTNSTSSDGSSGTAGSASSGSASSSDSNTTDDNSTEPTDINCSSLMEDFSILDVGDLYNCVDFENLMKLDTDWVDANTINLDVDLGEECYLETVDIDGRSSGVNIHFVFPPVDFIESLPLEMISNFFLALIYVLGVSRFLGDR
jgi:hypothetical protein